VSIHMGSSMTNESRDAVIRFAEAAGAQLLISGHEHVYARSGDLPASALTQVIVGGGGADLYPVVRTGLRAAASRHHHLIIDASPDRLHGRAMDCDGQELDSWTWKM
jgi:hypothetical protein